MIKIVVAYDDNDPYLAEYFEESYKNFSLSSTSLLEVEQIVLRGLDCTEANVNQKLSEIKGKPFLFIGLSHGDEDGTCLLTDNDTYVSQENAINFSNSLFYTTGCNAGIKLRESLLNIGCSVFIGYVDNSKAPLNETYNSMFIDCELFAIKKFLNCDNSIGELYDEMLAYTQTQIDWLFANDEILEAMDLQSNKDCMIIDGNRSLTRKNFELV